MRATLCWLRTSFIIARTCYSLFLVDNLIYKLYELSNITFLLNDYRYKLRICPNIATHTYSYTYRQLMYRELIFNDLITLEYCDRNIYLWNFEQYVHWSFLFLPVINKQNFKLLRFSITVGYNRWLMQKVEEYYSRSSLIVFLAIFRPFWDVQCATDQILIIFVDHINTD